MITALQMQHTKRSIFLTQYTNPNQCTCRIRMQYCRTKCCLKQKLERNFAATFPAFRATLQRHCVELHAVRHHDQAPLLAVSHAAQEFGRSPVLKRWS